jgi:hypothetical protein
MDAKTILCVITLLPTLKENNFQEIETGAVYLLFDCPYLPPNILRSS